VKDADYMLMVMSANSTIVLLMISQRNVNAQVNVMELIN
jgi:hypothetical protein